MKDFPRIFVNFRKGCSGASGCSTERIIAVDSELKRFRKRWERKEKVDPTQKPAAVKIHNDWELLII